MTLFGSFSKPKHARAISLSRACIRIFNGAARQIMRKRIREQSEAVGRYVASHPEAREFYEFWGRPDWEFLGEPPTLRSQSNE
jgi:hypothetical protein